MDDVGIEVEDWRLDLGVEVQSEGSAFVGLLLVCCDGIDGWTVVWTEVIEVEFWSGHGGRAGELVEVLLNRWKQLAEAHQTLKATYIEDSIICDCRSWSLNWPTNCRSGSEGHSDHVALSIGLTNARAWPNQPRSIAVVDELFNRLVGLFRVFSEESSSVEGRRTRELGLASSIRGKLPTHLVKVAAGRNDRNHRDDDSEELVKAD